jgi:small GTP-binding protein
LLLLALGSVVVLWKLLRPTPRTGPKKILDEAGLRQRLDEADQSGIDIQAAQAELEQLSKRKQSGKIYFAIAGDISTGKSSLVNSLLPGARAEAAVTGGTTTEITEYHWTTPSADEVIIIDLPGLQDAGSKALSAEARNEAMRAHVVIYVCNGDLTQHQLDELRLLDELEKPLILAFNKSDWYAEDERRQILERLKERTQSFRDISIVTISTLQQKTRTVRQPDGTEVSETIQVDADVSALARLLQRKIDTDPKQLDRLRDSAIFALATQTLEAAELEHRMQRGAELVRNHTRSAVVGALAAISPGSDILIQGAVGVSLVKSMCSLYDVPVSQLEIDRLLKLGQSRLNRHIAVLMAVTGNALKAFPGLGTLAGGALHAVTYGMIFDALGRSLNETLARRGELATLPVVNRFTETLGDQLEKRTAEIVRMVMEAKTTPRK